MSMKVTPPGWGADAGTQAFTGTSASKVVGFVGQVRFKALGDDAYIRINDQSSDTAVATDYPLTNGIPEDFTVSEGAYVHVVQAGSAGGNLSWFPVS